MSPIDDDVPLPRRTDDELIALVHEKVDRLQRARRRRTRAAVIGATSLLVFALVAISAVAAGSDHPSDLNTADEPVTTTSTESTEPATSIPDTTILSDPTTVGPTTTPPTAEPSTSTTEPATTTTLLPDCRSSNFAAQLTIGGTTFPRGEIIPITVAIQNLGPECWSGKGPGNPDVYDLCLQLGVSYSSGGGPVWSTAATGETCTGDLLVGPVRAGWSKSYLKFWRQVQCLPTDCTMVQVAAGSYSISVLDGWPGVVVQPGTVTIG